MAVKRNTPQSSSVGDDDLFINYDDFFQEYESLLVNGDSVNTEALTVKLVASDEDELDESSRESKKWRGELENLVVMALPITATTALEYLPMMVTVLLVGNAPSSTQQNNEEEKLWIAATALGETLYKCIAVFTGLGLNSALDTLCSQAYGAKVTDLLGVYLQTSMILTSLLSFATGVILLNCEVILLAIGQPAEVANLAGVWCFYVLPGLPFRLYFDSLRRVMQAQHIVNPQFYIVLVANVVYAGMGYYFVHHTAWTWLGAAVGRSIFDFLCFSSLVLYNVYIENSFWNGFQLREAIQDIPNFLKLGVPGMCQFCFEWWSINLLVVFSGNFQDEKISVVAVGASYVIQNIGNVPHILYYGISTAANVLVGNALGAGDHQSARAVSVVSLLTAEILAVLVAVLVFASGEFLTTLFTKDEEVTNVVLRVLVVLVLAQIPDAANNIVQGVLRGQGRQRVGAQILFLGCYGVCLPLAYCLAFPLNFGPVGLWCGYLSGLTVFPLVGVVVITKSDWKLLSEQARDRLMATERILTSGRGR